MKNLILILLLNVSVICFAPTFDKDHQAEIDKYKTYFEIKAKNDFKEAIAYRESRHNPLIVNSINCIGLYQFSKAARNAVGAPLINSNDIVRDYETGKRYLKNKEIWPIPDQNKAMDSLMAINSIRLKYEIDSLDGEIIHGVLITKSGLLAAAHLGGSGSVKKFIRSGYGAKDMNKTSIVDYMKEFGGFDF